MESSTATRLRIGAWCVDPVAGQISREGESIRVDARTLRLLLCLAQRAGEVVSVEELLDQAWAGVVVTPDSVYQAVASLRRVLGDDARRPAYIATVPRLGYRLVARVAPWVDSTAASADPAADPHTIDSLPGAPKAVATDSGGAPTVRSHGRRMAATWLSAAAVLGLAAIGAFLFQGKVAGDHARIPGGAAQRSVAVLPFLDLTTQDMNEEYFADGMTEELIDRLSKVQGLRVPPPTSSFYFKGKKVTVAQIAGSLGVAYVLDGSIRKSGETLRIAARLVRASDGYVIWSDTYDRPYDDKLKVQDDIAIEVTKALRMAID